MYILKHCLEAKEDLVRKCQWSELPQTIYVDDRRWRTVNHNHVCCRRSCTTALAHPRKVAPAGRKLGLVHWIFISCVIWSMTQASLPPLCQILLWCTVIFLVFLVLHLGYEVLCELVTQALATWTIWADGGRWTRTLHLMLAHHVLAWCHTQIGAGRRQCGMNHLSYLS